MLSNYTCYVCPDRLLFLFSLIADVLCQIITYGGNILDCQKYLTLIIKRLPHTNTLYDQVRPFAMN